MLRVRMSLEIYLFFIMAQTGSPTSRLKMGLDHTSSRFSVHVWFYFLIFMETSQCKPRNFLFLCDDMSTDETSLKLRSVCVYPVNSAMAISMFMLFYSYMFSYELNKFHGVMPLQINFIF